MWFSDVMPRRLSVYIDTVEAANRFEVAVIERGRMTCSSNCESGTSCPVSVRVLYLLLACGLQPTSVVACH